LGIFGGSGREQQAAEREPSNQTGHAATKEGFRAGNVDPNKRGLGAEIQRAENGQTYER
jgi:hypothetical protein